MQFNWEHNQPDVEEQNKKPMWKAVLIDRTPLKQKYDIILNFKRLEVRKSETLNL